MVFRSPISFTVMRKVQGQLVKLEENKSFMIEYWDCFKALCKDILLPLAEMDIIYRDLRPGSDCTYNVLLVKDKVNKEKKKMVLIDYESLARGVDYEPPQDERYPIPSEDREESISHDFLFQQCVGIAYSWIEDKKADTFSFNDALVWWSKAMQLNVLITTDNNLSETERKEEESQRAIESSLEWWEQMLSDSHSGDPRVTEAAFDQLFDKLDECMQKAQRKTTKVKTPCAKSHTITAEVDRTKDTKRQKTS